MSDFISLTCPSCGGRLQITDDIDRFACAYCGVEHLVRRGGGIVTLAPVLDGLRQVQAGIDRAASELAVRRLEWEINHLAEQYRVLAGQLSALPAHPSWRPVWRALGWGLVTALLAVCLLTSAGLILLDGDGAAWTFGVAPVVAILVLVGIVWLGWRSVQREKQQLSRQRARMQFTLATLSRQIEDRQRQLIQHRRIISG